MKKLLLFAFLLLFVSSAAAAQQSDPLGYIGLYADRGTPPNPDYPHCVTGVGFYPIEMWIWCLPGSLGQICAEFMIEYPTNIIQSNVTSNPALSVTLGTLPEGMSACYAACQTSWHWLFHQTLYVNDTVPKTYCRVVAHPDVGVYQFANCEYNYPTEPCIRHCDLNINTLPTDPECALGTHAASWGAIKNIYR